MRSATTNSASKQLLEHLGMNRTASTLSIRSVALQTGGLFARRKQPHINRVEVDF
jgi:hypothetical protein